MKADEDHSYPFPDAKGIGWEWYSVLEKESVQDFQPIAVRVLDKVKVHLGVFKADAAHFPM